MAFSKLIINAAINGLVPTREQTPYVPITPKEIATDACRAGELGASIVHIHARENDGTPSHSKEIYAEIIQRIRAENPDIIITVSTSGRKTKNIEKRMEVLELDGSQKPDMASITLGSLNFMDGWSQNDPDIISMLLEKARQAGIYPELEIFDLGMSNYARYLIDHSLLPPPCYANLFLGSLGTIPASPKNLVHLSESLPDNTTWAATGVGRFAFEVQCLAITMGGHVRVGIEDSLFMDQNKTELATNEKLIQRVTGVAESVGRAIATPQEVRKLLNI